MRLLLSVTLLIAAAAAPGCSSDTVEPAAETATTCSPQSMQAWTPEWVPPRAAQPDGCTDAQIQTIYTTCYSGAPSAEAACSTLARAANYAACWICLVTVLGDRSYGPIVVLRRAESTNVAGCVALVEGDTSASGCGAAIQAASMCEEQSCIDACRTSPYEAHLACKKLAMSTTCNSYEAAASCAGDDARMACFFSDFGSSFLGLAPVFCAAPATGDAGGDASGDSATDAATDGAERYDGAPDRDAPGQ